jgi:hypothetical protein
MKKISSYYFMLLVGFVALSCKSLPDISPFAAQTRQLAYNMQDNYARTESLLKALDTSKKDERKRLIDFRNQWKPTQKMMDAMVGYADTLAELSLAGKQGAEAVQKLSGGLNGLATTFGASTILTDPVINTLAFVNKKRVEAKAANSLIEALDPAQDVIDSLTPLLQANLKSLRHINQGVGALLRIPIGEKDGDFARYYDVVKEGTRRQIKELTAIEQFLQSRDPEVLTDIYIANLVATDPQINQKLEARQKQLLTLLDYYRREMKEYQDDHNRYVDNITKVSTLLADNDKLLDKTKKAISIWVISHKKIRIAIEKKKQISFVELESAIAELKTLIK